MRMTEPQIQQALMKQGIAHAKGMIQGARECDRIARSFVCARGKAQHPQKHRRGIERYYASVRAKSKPARALPMRVKERDGFFQMCQSSLQTLEETEVIAQYHLPFKHHVRIVKFLCQTHDALCQLIRFV